MSTFRRVASVSLALPLLLGVSTAPAHAMSIFSETPSPAVSTPPPAPIPTETAAPTAPPATPSPVPTVTEAPTQQASSTPTATPGENSAKPHVSEPPAVIPNPNAPQAPEAPANGNVPWQVDNRDNVGNSPVNGGQQLNPAQSQGGASNSTPVPTLSEDSKKTADSSPINPWVVAYWSLGAVLVAFFIFTVVRALRIVRKGNHRSGPR